MRASALLFGAEELNKRGDAVASRVWLNDALKGLPKGAEFIRYMAIPLEVKLGDIPSASTFAESTMGDMRIKAFGAIAITCAEQNDAQGLSAAVAKIKTPGVSTRDDADMTAFAGRLQLLNVSAALIDQGQFKQASELVDFVQANMDDISRLSLEREVQLQRTVILARENEFARGKDLALKMRPDSVADVQRGTALRTLSFLETKAQGAAASRSWAMSLRDPEDRAYALLGIAQSLLGIDDPQLPYSAINIH